MMTFSMWANFYVRQKRSDLYSKWGIIVYDTNISDLCMR